MNPNRLFTVPILVIGIYLILAAPPLVRSTPTSSAEPDATFTIFFSDGSNLVATSSDLIGLQPNQAVNVAVQYPLSAIGRRISAEPLDGGRVLGAAQQLVVNANGTIQFQFQTGSGPGIYQVSLHDGANEIGIRFWVFDSEIPADNPQVVNQ